MKPILCFALAASIVAPWAAPVLAAPRHAPKGWKTFDSPNFSVFYPAGWKVRGVGIKKFGAPPDADSVGFTSPDGRAQFALYSPLWNGDPGLLSGNPKRENPVAYLNRTSRSNDGAHSQIETVWKTFRALDGTYTRSIVDVENKTLNTRRLFGFRYKDAATYHRFLPRFQRFKASLEQYSD